MYRIQHEEGKGFTLETPKGSVERVIKKYGDLLNRDTLFELKQVIDSRGLNAEETEHAIKSWLHQAQYRNRAFYGTIYYETATLGFDRYLLLNEIAQHLERGQDDTKGAAIDWLLRYDNILGDVVENLTPTGTTSAPQWVS